MRLSQATRISLLSAGLLAQNVVAGPVPNAIPVALADALAEPQSCAIPCSDDGSLCCTTNQVCSAWGSSCGARSDSDSGATEVVTATTTFAQPIGTPSGSGLISYPTLTPTTLPSGTNTFVVPIPSATSTVAFGQGGIIGVDSAPQGLTAAQIGGIVGGILGAFFLIALILFCCCMRRGGGGGGFFVGGSGRHEVVAGGSSHHSHGGGLATAAGAGLMGWFLGRKKSHAGSTHSVSHHHGSSAAKKTGMAALLGGAAAGLTSIFASRRKGRMSEKYSTTDMSSGYYSSDITEETEYTSNSSSSSSSSSSPSSGHGRH